LERLQGNAFNDDDDEKKKRHEETKIKPVGTFSEIGQDVHEE